MNTNPKQDFKINLNRVQTVNDLTIRTAMHPLTDAHYYISDAEDYARIRDWIDSDYETRKARVMIEAYAIAMMDAEEAA